ncbi:MAG: NERD domain-containing protein [Desulfomicrobium sp.]
MAYIYGSTAPSSITRASARRKDMLLRVALPLFFILILAGAGLYAFKQQQHWISAFFAVFFVAAVLRFEELGLTVSHYLSHSQANARGGQIVARALEQLPNEYHIFHDLHFGGARIDHAVIGPSGFFPIRVGSHLGNISASGESLRLNGWPFLLDMLSGCWNQTQKLIKHLGVQYRGDVHPCPVLCFSRASVGIAGPVRGALVVEAGNLVPAILAHEESLPPDKILLLVEKLSALVGATNAAPFRSQDDSPPFPEPADSSQPSPNSPLCSKCGHKPTPGEFALFPGECPKCGRLYSFDPDKSEPSSTGPAKQRLWKPGMPQLAMAALLVAGSAGYLAHSQGLLDQWRSTPHAATPDESPASDAANVSPAPSVIARTTVNASRTAASAPPDTAMPQPITTAAATIQQSNQTANNTEAPTMREAETGIAVNASLAIADIPTPDAARTNATSAAAKTQAPAKASSTKPADPFEHGKLVVTAVRPVTLWFKNQQTYKEFGPFEIKSRGTRDIVLPKGFYSVVYVENGMRRHTTMSFLSDKGQLDF